MNSGVLQVAVTRLLWGFSTTHLTHSLLPGAKVWLSVFSVMHYSFFFLVKQLPAMAQLQAGAGWIPMLGFSPLSSSDRWRGGRALGMPWRWQWIALCSTSVWLVAALPCASGPERPNCSVDGWWEAGAIFSASCLSFLPAQRHQVHPSKRLSCFLRCSCTFPGVTIQLHSEWCSHLRTKPSSILSSWDKLLGL